MADTEQPHELVIIRRRAASDLDAVKGGVWKIAFADFMTAMMAFFLVMWLINAANEETKQAVASYFNPVKLSSISNKGLEDPQASHAEAGKPNPEETSASPEPVAPDNEAEAAPTGAQTEPKFPEEALFRDPYAVLAELAGAGEGAGEVQSAPRAGAGNAAGLNGGEAFRDPFDPAFWQDVQPIRTDPSPPEEDTLRAEDAPEALEPGPASAEIEPAVVRVERVSDAVEQTPAVPAPLPRRPEDREGAAKPGELEPQPGDAQGAGLQAELTEAFQAEAASLHAPNIEVTQTGEGVLISLTDDVEFGMFAIGSAEPQPELIAIMGKIARILEEESGEIVIRGHTDGRPFRSDSYDNWRLSTARAHMAYYMLVRGGLSESRVERIEGYADRALLIPEHPEAAQNRRIEILVREAT